MDFHIPEYTNTDSRCPVVTRHEIQTEDCSALSTDFENSGTLALSNGIYRGVLKDDSILFTYKFCLKISTSVNFITVPLLEFAICSYSTIVPVEEILKKQIYMIGNSNKEFKIPEFLNTDSPRCPGVSDTKITTFDCATLHEDFDNSATLSSSLSSGFYFGKLVDETTPTSYDFCLKIFANKYFITVKKLEFVVCSPDTILPTEKFALK